MSKTDFKETVGLSILFSGIFTFIIALVVVNVNPENFSWISIVSTWPLLFMAILLIVIFHHLPASLLRFTTRLNNDKIMNRDIKLLVLGIFVALLGNLATSAFIEILSPRFLDAKFGDWILLLILSIATIIIITDAFISFLKKGETRK